MPLATAFADQIQRKTETPTRPQSRSTTRGDAKSRSDAMCSWRRRRTPAIASRLGNGVGFSSWDLRPRLVHVIASRLSPALCRFNCEQGISYYSLSYRTVCPTGQPLSDVAQRRRPSGGERFARHVTLLAMNSRTRALLASKQWHGESGERSAESQMHTRALLPSKQWHLSTTDSYSSP